MANRLPHIPNRLPQKRKNEKGRIIFVVGPTGAGKSQIAAELAGKINGEIVSCDSMQVYKKMRIIAGAPSSLLKRRIRHHLLDIISPEEEFNAADYQRLADLKIKEIIKRNRIPIFVGGAGFYMSVLLDGLFRQDVKNKKIRENLHRQAKKYGTRRLYQRLIKIDPLAASKIHPHDLRRVVRALEVYKSVKVPISELQKERKGILNDYDVKILCLDRDRSRLYKRIEERVRQMYNQGLIREVKGLLKLRLSKTASQAIGIKEINGYLRGEYDLAEAKRLIKRNTRRYAKRQLSWFKSDKRIEWISITEKEGAREVARRLWKRLC